MLTILCTSLTLIIATPAEVQAPTTAPAPAPSGWSIVAGTTGAITGATVLGLALVAERLKLTGNLQGIPYGVTALSLGAVAPPLVFLSAWAGRRSSGARGAPALRVAGWIAYGGFLLVGTIAGVTAVQQKEPMNGMIAMFSGFAALSLSLFASDGFVAWRQTRTSRRRAHRRRAHTAWVPWVAPVLTPDRATGGLVGVAGWF